MEKEYKVTFSEQEIQAVFDALVEQPFKKVAPLVARIQAIYQAVQNGGKAEDSPA